ncbi:Peptidase S33 tripeptidyl aminopeptidase-like C-terminal [Penicillium lagena]|uniref:Peptidase S33 tripeptidyl aminopeptidase-like C-terminal n=1 Tax=Penicillium lagena TaxID=94218 RepID=UPI002540A1C0|nr:Peptidase S33 tripeptidyl aminopeptidase-like C-terminal [Penicillium lagena]KAJ5605461.1 Peptidase S33 tripeptidyl aminopeptidase-like C-terminal [Penicillium lagena]
MDDAKSTERRGRGNPPLCPQIVPPRRRYGVRWALPLLAATMTFMLWPVPLPLPRAAPVSTLPFSWDQLIPSSSLDYYSCGDGFQCARLEVPMDYNRTDGKSRKFALAVARLPARVPVTDPRYGGAILINPGGPGGPGTLQAFVSGRDLQKIVDAENDPTVFPPSGGTADKYFDIIGFDPRGVGATTPAVVCFPDAVSQRNWELQLEAEGMLGSSADALHRNWQRTMALNTGCSTTDLFGEDGEEAMMAHLNTPLVAQDMATIIERHGEWRGLQGQKAQQIHDQCHGYDEMREIERRTQWHQGQEQLLYWGRSYGTVLGTTFAALFPERVSRAVLDGVVNMDTYYEGRGPNAVVDADAIFDRFAEYCNTVGWERCPMYVPGGPETIKQKYQSLEASVLNLSMPVPASGTRGPEVVTWTDMKALLRVAVYQPLLAFSVFAHHMSELARGNAAPLADFKHSKHFGVCPSEDCIRAGPWSPACARGENNGPYASAAILCSDGEFLTQQNQDDFEVTWNGLRADSAVLGDYWATIHLSCVGWQTRAKQRFLGPWGGHTAHPILFVSNTLDPVTSLRSAHHMSQQFPGSVVLQQDSEGHTTLAAPSLCVAKGIRNYFQTGILPEPETLCQADLKPMGEPDQASAFSDGLEPADRDLFAALMAEVTRGHWAGLPL